MPDTSSNNKRIAKNTLVLYVRMFLMMALSLFTSRVILQVLGVEDFGIYNVVGGIVSMMGVINGAMSVSTQRYLTFELGKEDVVRLKQVFCMCLQIYMMLGVLLILLAETIGVWFLNTQLVIPESRLTAANWVFQFSIYSSVCSLLTNPYNAVIISHEKMGVYAYISIADVVLSLAICYLLLVIPIDKLSTYGFLMFLLRAMNCGFYWLYCHLKHKETKYTFYWETALFKKLISYTGWNLFGSTAGLVKGQGLNILLNMFFNPSVNAARGIAYQVNSAVHQFFTNFYTAVRPQITKYYAQGDMDNMFKLVFRSSKLSFFLILFISLPLIVEAPFVIRLWLGQMPEYVVPFMRLIIMITAVDSMANPLMTTAHATGNIALYQSLVGSMTILNIPISYVFLSLGFSPLIVFDVSLIISVINLFLRLWIVKRLVNFPVWEYISKILFICLVVSMVSSILPIILHYYISPSIAVSLMVLVVSLLSAGFTIWMIGLTREERQFATNLLKKKLKR